MNAEELFLKKYGNKITAAESWVIRFAEEYAQSQTEALKKEIEELKADALERYKKAENYIANAEGLFCEGSVYSDSGYTYDEVFEAIKIAAGLTPPNQ